MLFHFCRINSPSASSKMLSVRILPVKSRNPGQVRRSWSSKSLDMDDKFQIFEFQNFRVQSNHLAESMDFHFAEKSFLKSNFQIFENSIFDKKWNFWKMKLLVLNGITRVFSIIYFMIKTRFKLNKITKVVTDVILMVKTPVFESKCLQSEKVIFDQKYVFRHQNSHFWIQIYAFEKTSFLWESAI